MRPLLGWVWLVTLSVECDLECSNASAELHVRERLGGSHLGLAGLVLDAALSRFLT